MLLAMRLLALTMAALALTVSTAHGDGNSALKRLAHRHLHPAPLVPTTAPPSLRPIDSTLQLSGHSRTPGAYALRLVHNAPNGPEAIIALSRGDFHTLHAAIVDARRASFKVRRAGIRGKHGYLMTSTTGDLEYLLAWKEDGQIYEIGTGTTGTVSLAQLKATATGLKHLKS
jgi:hypothetical protein